MTDHSKKEIAKEGGEKRVFASEVNEADDRKHSDEAAKAYLRMPVDFLEAWVANGTDHEIGGKQHEIGKEERELEVVPSEKEHDSGNHACGGRDGQTNEVATRVSDIVRAHGWMCDHVEARKPNCRAKQVDKSEEESDFRGVFFVVVSIENQENDHESRCEAKAYNICDRVEFLAKQRLAPAYASDASVERIAEHAAENKNDGLSVEAIGYGLVDAGDDEKTGLDAALDR